MVQIFGELYYIQIDHDKITATPKVTSLPAISAEANPEEDFSVFDLGPAIASSIKMQTGLCKVGLNAYAHACIDVEQKAGDYIIMTIRQPRTNDTDPVDSGAVIHVFKDYVVKYG